MPVNRSSQFLQPNWESARSNELEAEYSFLHVQDKRVNTFLTVTEDGLSSGSMRLVGTVSFQIWRNIILCFKPANCCFCDKNTPSHDGWLPCLSLYLLLVTRRKWPQFGCHGAPAAKRKWHPFAIVRRSFAVETWQAGQRGSDKTSVVPIKGLMLIVSIQMASCK